MGNQTPMKNLREFAKSFRGRGQLYSSPNRAYEDYEIRRFSYGNDGNEIYDNIIIVAHSLGSVVAYDILTLLFPGYQSTCKVKPGKTQDIVKDFARYVAENKDSLDPEEYQKKQVELRNNFQFFEYKWKVSKFITLGSPLTHAEMILAKGEKEFRERINLRELPTCPPVSDHKDPHKFFYGKNVLVPHHAAFFAITKWTNIYFGSDLIGGPLRDLFGNGIHDIRIHPEGWRWRKLPLINPVWRNLPLISHTLYWHKTQKKAISRLKTG